MSFGDGDLHKRVEELEARCSELEELVRYIEPWIENKALRKILLGRMEKYGIEVEE